MFSISPCAWVNNEIPTATSPHFRGPATRWDKCEYYLTPTWVVHQNKKRPVITGSVYTVSCVAPTYMEVTNSNGMEQRFIRRRHTRNCVYTSGYCRPFLILMYYPCRCQIVFALVPPCCWTPKMWGYSRWNLVVNSCTSWDREHCICTSG